MASPALIAAALAVLAPHGPQSPMAVAKKMSADYKKAMINEDISYFEKNATSDFEFVDAQGRKGHLKETLMGIKQGFAMTTKVHRLEEKIVSARRTKEGIFSVGDVYMEATVDMGGKPGKMVSKMRVETLVVPKGNAWHYKRIWLAKDDTKVNGKPMGM
ncbi:hypothetical protein EON82_13160 [bacterium]|nr:MAG: hypothetical protein EON82_13160 [bacterium]